MPESNLSVSLGNWAFHLYVLLRLCLPAADTAVVTTAVVSKVNGSNTHLYTEKQREDLRSYIDERLLKIVPLAITITDDMLPSVFLSKFGFQKLAEDGQKARPGGAINTHIEILCYRDASVLNAAAEGMTIDTGCASLSSITIFQNSASPKDITSLRPNYRIDKIFDRKSDIS